MTDYVYKPSSPLAISTEHTSIGVRDIESTEIMLNALMALDSTREYAIMNGISCVKWGYETDPDDAEMDHAVAKQLADWLLPIGRNGVAACRISSSIQHELLRTFWIDCVNTVPGIRRIDVAVERRKDGIVRAKVTFACKKVSSGSPTAPVHRLGRSGMGTT